MEELYNPEFHRSLTVGIWEKEYNSEISYIDSYDFEELFRDYSDKIDIQKNPWKTVLLSIIELQQIIEK